MYLLLVTLSVALPLGLVIIHYEFQFGTAYMTITVSKLTHKLYSQYPFGNTIVITPCYE